MVTKPNPHTIEYADATFGFGLLDHHVDGTRGMPKVAKDIKPMSASEWNSLPVTFGCDVAARLYLASPRYVSDHAEEFGGRMIAGKWHFTKSRVAEILGLDMNELVLEE